MQKFEVTLQKDREGELGVELLPEQGIADVLVVIRFAYQGLPWNANPDKQLKVADRIVSINGEPASKSRLDEVPTGDVRMGVERWAGTYEVSLARASKDDKVGVSVELVEGEDGARFLRIGGIKNGGLLLAHNRSCVASKRLDTVVTPGTALLEVCGLSNAPDEMVALLKSEHVQLTLRRPGPTVVELFAMEAAALLAMARAGDVGAAALLAEAGDGGASGWLVSLAGGDAAAAALLAEAAEHTAGTSVPGG